METYHKVNNMKAITPKKCIKLITKKFNLEDTIIIYNENPEPPFDEGWATDKAKYVIKVLSEEFDQDKKYHFTVGLVRINTNLG
jgi:hypothetical protein